MEQSSRPVDESKDSNARTTGRDPKPFTVELNTRELIDLLGAPGEGGSLGSSFMRRLETDFDLAHANGCELNENWCWWMRERMRVMATIVEAHDQHQRELLTSDTFTKLLEGRTGADSYGYADKTPFGLLCEFMHMAEAEGYDVSLIRRIAFAFMQHDPGLTPELKAAIAEVGSTRNEAAQ